GFEISMQGRRLVLSRVAGAAYRRQSAIGAIVARKPGFPSFGPRDEKCVPRLPSQIAPRSKPGHASRTCAMCDVPLPMARERPQDHFAYPPRLLRAPQAARYMAMGERTFLRKVDEGKLPKPKRLDGVVAWDRYQLDAAVDDADSDAAGNSVDRL